MAVVRAGSRVIAESAGPIWHLVGHLDRDRHFFRVTVHRPLDTLTEHIGLAAGEILPTVQLTDHAGHTLRLQNAVIESQGIVPPPRDPSHGQVTGSREWTAVSFTFETIQRQGTSGSSLFNDDWGAGSSSSGGRHKRG